jgi:hypothetical protein
MVFGILSFMGCLGARCFQNYVEQLGDRFVASGFGVAQTVAGITLNNNTVEACDRSFNSRELMNNVAAASFFINHTLHTANLAFDAAQSHQDIVTSFRGDGTASFRHCEIFPLLLNANPT